MSFSSLSSSLMGGRIQNIQTGLGSRDLMSSATTKWLQRLDQLYLDALYVNSPFAQLCCNYTPNKSFIKGGTLVLGGDEKNSSDIIYQVNNWILSNNRLKNTSIKAASLFPEAQRRANRTGGAILLMLFDDEMLLHEPVDVEGGSRVKELRVFDRFSVRPAWGNSYYAGKVEPEYYQFYTRSFDIAANGLIHKSRVLPFYGTQTEGENLIWLNDGWPCDTILRNIAPEIGRLDVIDSTVAEKIQRAHVFLYGVKDLVANLGKSAQQRNKKHMTETQYQGYEQKIAAEAETIYNGLQNLNVVGYDMDNRKIEAQVYKFEGVADIMQKMVERRVEVSGLPEFVVTGRHGSGLGQLEKGERATIQGLASEQQAVWQGNLETLINYELLAKKGVTQGIEPDIWSWKWNDLYELDPVESAEVKKIESETLFNIARTGQMLGQPILTSNEIRQSLFGGDKWQGLDITLEQETIEMMAAIDPVKDSRYSLSWTASGKTWVVEIETMPGEKRSPKHPPLVRTAYGSIKGLDGEDGDEKDIYIYQDFLDKLFDDRNPPSEIYKITQIDPDSRELDEYKMMLGFPSMEMAKAIYLINMEPARFGKIEQVGTLQDALCLPCKETIDYEGAIAELNKLMS